MNGDEFSIIKNKAKEAINVFIINDIKQLDINYKLYIYDVVGSILFKNKWEKTVKMFDTSSKKECIKFLQILQIINIYSREEKTDIVNIIFQTVLNLLVDDPTIKNI